MDGAGPPETPRAEERGWRRFFDLGHWIGGESAYLLAAGFALLSVMTGLGAVVSAAMAFAGSVDRARALTGSALGFGISILSFLAYRAADRAAVATGTNPEYPRATTFAVEVVEQGDALRRLLLGTTGGFIALEEDALHVRLKTNRGSLFGSVWVVVNLLPQRWSPLVHFGILAGAITLGIVDWIPRKRRHPWSEIPTATVQGRRVAFEYAVAGDRKDLVVEVAPKDRERLLALLAKRTRVEVLEEPVKPATAAPSPPPPRPAPPPPPPPPPRTAIDDAKLRELDETAERLKRL